VQLDAGGLNLLAGTAAGAIPARTVTWGPLAGPPVAEIYGYSIGSPLINGLSVTARGQTEAGGQLALTGASKVGSVLAGVNAFITLYGGGAVANDALISIDAGEVYMETPFALITGTLQVQGALNVGVAVGAGVGSIFTQAVAPVELRMTDTNSDRRMRLIIASNGVTLASQAQAGAPAPFTLTSNSFGWGVTPAAKPTISGSRAGNAALTSLLSGLAALGWVVNSTSA
jgi:hypothetical protein